MSIRVVIGSSERNLNDIEPNWINEQIGRRKMDSVPVCVKVHIQNDSVNMSLATNDCPCSGGGSRRANHQEQEIFDLWNKLHLNDNEFSSGNLIAFLKQLA